MIFALITINKFYTVSGVDSSHRARMFYAADGSILGSTLSLFNTELYSSHYIRIVEV